MKTLLNAKIQKEINEILFCGRIVTSFAIKPDILVFFFIFRLLSLFTRLITWFESVQRTYFLSFFQDVFNVYLVFSNDVFAICLNFVGVVFF